MPQKTVYLRGGSAYNTEAYLRMLQRYGFAVRYRDYYMGFRLFKERN